MQIFYGKEGQYLCDVTKKALYSFMKRDYLELPADDYSRAKKLGDPLAGVVKDIIIVKDGERLIYPATESTKIFIPKWWLHATLEPKEKLDILHSRYNFIGGRIKDEYPEQVMAATFITPSSKVLEIGSNIGRTTLTIAGMLSDEQNLVTLESSPRSVKILKQNRDNNELKFHIEDSALSSKRLIQRGWNTILSDTDLPGYFPVKTITWETLKSKYQIEFDTLVLDCEGAFFYVIEDFPDIIKNIRLVIIENDYDQAQKKAYVDKIFLDNDLKLVYSEPLLNASWHAPCAAHFYEVWSK